MKNAKYTDEKNVLILLSLLKKYGISRIVSSPGSTNVTFIASAQNDDFFEIYSCVDERSASYMACGMAAESGNPVVLSCTGAGAASRNYYSALTEAFYRKLPIIAVTSTQDIVKVGHLFPQVVDRSLIPNDVCKCSVHLQNIKDDDDAFDCIIKVNKALLELDHHGRGPVHINLSTKYSQKYSHDELPDCRKIERVMQGDVFPEIPQGKIAVYIGSHAVWQNTQITALEAFCHKYGAVVFSDPAANYKGNYYVNYQLVAAQSINDENVNPDLLIHLGEMSDFASVIKNPKEVWRLSPDGYLADRYRKLTKVFEMPEEYFFSFYSREQFNYIADSSYIESCKKSALRIRNKTPELPFSNLWAASILSKEMPQNSVLHLGILSPVRSWCYFDLDSSISVYCNQGAFGIDGNMSTLIGASLVNSSTIYYGVFGDLSFFYDINVLGNRHIANNVRILLVNNSLAVEFKLFKQHNCVVVDDLDSYISAAGHNSNKSKDLAKHIAEDMGFEYLRADSKESFKLAYPKFVSCERTDKPILFELFTSEIDENEALSRMWHIEETIDVGQCIKNKISNILKK